MSDDTGDAGQERRAQPESFRARSLQASLTVKDLEASVDWYERMVGFMVQNRYEYEGEVRAVSLLAGDVRILLNKDDGKRGWDRVKGEGFSLNFTTMQDVDPIASRIKERGGTLDSEPADMPWGVRSFRVRDPDGYRLAFSKPL